MKKVISFICALGIMACISVSPIAAAENVNNEGTNIVATENGQIVNFADGSYAVIEGGEVPSIMRSSSKTGEGKFTYYNSKDVPQYLYRVVGQFSYGEGSATCTSVYKTFTVYDDDWRTSSEPYKSGNKAIADFTVKRYVIGIPMTTTKGYVCVSCSSNGQISVSYNK